MGQVIWESGFKNFSFYSGRVIISICLKTNQFNMY